jgi:hypothetical protein
MNFDGGVVSIAPSPRSLGRGSNFARRLVGNGLRSQIGRKKQYNHQV